MRIYCILRHNWKRISAAYVKRLRKTPIFILKLCDTKRYSLQITKLRRATCVRLTKALLCISTLYWKMYSSDFDKSSSVLVCRRSNNPCPPINKSKDSEQASNYTFSAYKAARDAIASEAMFINHFDYPIFYFYLNGKLFETRSLTRFVKNSAKSDQFTHLLLLLSRMRSGEKQRWLFGEN